MDFFFFSKTVGSVSVGGNGWWWWWWYIYRLIFMYLILNGFLFFNRWKCQCLRLEKPLNCPPISYSQLKCLESWRCHWLIVWQEKVTLWPSFSRANTVLMLGCRYIVVMCCRLHGGLNFWWPTRGPYTARQCMCRKEKVRTSPVSGGIKLVIPTKANMGWRLDYVHMHGQLRHSPWPLF